jgi:GNAT superfamily N-acetyltransferase
MARAFIVRVANPADEQAVTALLEASYPTLMRTGYDKAEFDAALPAMIKANPALLNSGTFYVATVKETHVVGCGGWSAEPPGSGNKVDQLGHIRHFATHPDWIGQSIGRSIYDACEVDAAANGITEFECHSSLVAEKFYTALGFKSKGVVNIPMADNAILPYVLMHRLL